MLKILGFFVGALFTVWAFNKFVPSDTREEILETTDSVIVATANKIEQADLGEIVEQGTNVIQEAASTVGHKVDNANIGEIVDQGTDRHPVTVERHALWCGQSGEEPFPATGVGENTGQQPGARLYRYRSSAQQHHCAVQGGWYQL